MKILCKVLSGSRSHGLANEQSDFDHYHVSLDTEINKIIGLDETNSSSAKLNDLDCTNHELRRFLSLLRKGNIQALECVFSEDFIECDLQFKQLVINVRHKFFDTVKIYKSLMGYVQGEKKKITGESRSNLGSKRRIEIDQLGFARKNAICALRLLYAGQQFILHRVWPVNLQNYNKSKCEWLRAIKERPTDFTRDLIISWIEEGEQTLKYYFDSRNEKDDYKPDNDYLNNVLLNMYYPIIQKCYHEIQNPN